MRRQERARGGIEGQQVHGEVDGGGTRTTGTDGESRQTSGSGVDSCTDLAEGGGGDGEPFANERIARAVETSVGTVSRVRQLFVEEGMEAALYRKPPKRHDDRQLDGEKEARLVAIACSKPPEGRRRWTMPLLAEKLIELKMVDTISDDTVHRTLKNESKPWLKEQWVLPAESNGGFVAAREDGWAVYKRPYDAQPPVVCWEQASPQLVAEVNAPLPPEPGQPERVDDEYERGGTAKVFMVFEPLAGQRRVEVRARRTAVDFAHVVRRLVDVD